MTRLINLDDEILPFSVGGLDRYAEFRGQTALCGGEEVSLDVVAENIELMLSLVEPGESPSDVRWLVVTNRQAQVPHHRKWRAMAPLLEVESISMAYKVAEVGVENNNFEGTVDYVLVNHVKLRRMLVMVMFDNENDAILWKMRAPPTGQATLVA